MKLWRLPQGLLLLLCWLLLLEAVSSEHLLSTDVLEYMDVVADLAEYASDPELPSQISNIASTLGFSQLSYYWEAPFNAVDETEFAQVILGRKDSVCYAVIHGLPMEEGYQFVSNPQPLENLYNWGNCDETSNPNCNCRAHWHWVERNVPSYWQNIHEQLESCMSSCNKRFGDDQCDLVLGGHGAGGSVATLLSFHFATTIYEPYVIAAGSPDVLYDSGCPGINEDRYFRFVNTDFPGNGINPAFEILYLYGICFDDVPFLGADELKGIGHTIGLGLEKGAFAIATAGPGQLLTFELEATRESLCRSAHDFSFYKQKMQTALLRNPSGVTPAGFSNFQYCEVDQDCRSLSSCLPSSDFPICTVRNVPTPRPTTVIPTPLPTYSTPEPTTARPTPSPTTVIPTPLPTYSTPEPTTARPTLPNWTLAPATREPTKEPTPRPTRYPTVAPTTEAQNTPQPTTRTPSAPPNVATTVPSSSETNEDFQMGTEPTLIPSTEEPTAEEEDSTMTTLVPTDLFTGLPTQTPMPSADTTFSLTMMTKPPAEYESNDEDTAMEAPTQAPVATPSPTEVPLSALPLFDDFFRTTLVLRDVTQELTGFTVFHWEDETSEHLRNWIQKHTDDWDPPIVQLRVQSNIVSQNILFISQPVEASRTSGNTVISGIKEATQAEEEENHAAEAKKDKSTKERSARRSGKKSNRIRQRRRRRVQQTTTTSNTVAESLQIVFEIAIEYRTLNVQELDLYSLILEAFQSKEGREQYIQRLQGTNDKEFENISDLILQIQETPTSSVETAPGSSGGGEDKTIIWALIGAAGAAVVMSLAMFLWYLRRVKKGQKDASTSSDNDLAGPIFEPASGSHQRLSPDGQSAPRLAQEIVVDEGHDDGISTLGDPMFYPGAPPIMQDDHTASVNFAQNYLKMNPLYDDSVNRTFRSDQHSSNRSSMKDTVSGGSALTLSKVGSGLSHLNDSGFRISDDDSFEEAYAGQDECFKVLAPSGKLGIIIDLSGNGEPMVRAIRGDSVLADQVEIGDRLLSVDGEGCAEMTAEHVSKLIAVKSNQPTREIMFVRRPSDYINR